MKPHHLGRSILRLVWGLILLAMLTLSATLGMEAWTLRQLQRNRQDLLHGQDRAMQAMSDLTQFGDQARHQMRGLLNADPEIDPRMGAVSRYSQYLQTALEENSDPDLHQALSSLKILLPEIHALADQVRQWKTSRDELEQHPLAQVGMEQLRQARQQLRSGIDSILYEKEKEEELLLRSMLDTQGASTSQARRKLLQLYEIKTISLQKDLLLDLSELEKLTDQLASTDDTDTFSRLRNEVLPALLQRLENRLALLPPSHFTPSPGDSLAQIKTLLFGQNRNTEPVEEALVSYLLRRLQHTRDHAALHSSVSMLFEIMDDAYPPLAELTRSRAKNLTEQTEATLATGLRDTLLLGLATMIGILLTGRIIARRVRLQVKNLTQLSHHHDLILNSAGEGILGLSREGTVTFINQAASRMLEWPPEELVGKTLHEIYRCANESPQDACGQCPAVMEWKDGILNRDESLEFRRKNGAQFPVKFISTPILNESGTPDGAVILFTDNTEAKQAEMELQQKQEMLDHLAHHDPLTDLPNRLLFHDRLEHVLERAERNGSEAAVLFIDLDHFKNVNDSLGHEIGDKLLHLVAARLRSGLRQSDTLARLGGDEFVVVLEDVDTTEQIVRVASKLLQHLRPIFMIPPHQFYVTTSIGISRFPQDGKTVKELMRHADTAMYHAKNMGRNNFQLYSAEFNARAQELLRMETCLRTALGQNQFTLYYQPQVDISENRLIGMEALVRWQNPELGMVSPADFIPLAEKTGMIVPLGNWILKTACVQAKQWQQMGLPPLRVAVNISSIQFSHPDFVDTVEHTLAETGLDPQWLELEITESHLLEDTSKAIETLVDLKTRGLNLSLDDFGTGYSSLSYLRMFPVDQLKIDRSFIRDAASQESSAAIAISVIALGRAMRLSVVAEGVETDSQLEFLRANGCNIIQGYYFSPPLPAERFEAFVRNWPPRPTGGPP